MVELFFQGNFIFMGILTLLLLIILSIAVYRAIQMSKGNVEYETTFRYQITKIKSVGLFALVFGIFAHLLGLYQMFSVIEQGGTYSPALVAGGLKVSAISTIYGLIIFLLSYLLWLALDYMTGRVGASSS